MTPLHLKATPNPDYLVPPPPVLADPRAVFDRLMDLAGLARALDPSLPTHVRFYRRAEAAEDTRNEASFGVVFTNESQAIGMAQENEVEFWPALERTLPAHALAGERENLDAAPSYKFASSVDAAVYGAHRDGAISVHTVGTGDPEWVVQSTNGKRVPELDFLSQPSLARWLYLTPNAKVDEDSRLSPGLMLSRSRVRTLMDVLSRPYEDSSADERARVSESFKTLEEKRKASFEFNHQHSWIGYALAHGANGWTAPLLAMGASPHIPYNGELPVVWATVVDAGYDLAALSQAGASVSILLGSTAPKVYDEASQKRLENRLGDFSSLVGLAAACGASRAAATLCQRGANVVHADNRGASPLHMACHDNNEPLVRVLINQGASLTQEDIEGRIPSECIPFSGQSMFDWMEALRLGAPEIKSSAPALKLPTENKLPWVQEGLIEADKKRNRKP
jgi:hypothetical protein